MDSDGSQQSLMQDVEMEFHVLIDCITLNQGWEVRSNAEKRNPSVYETGDAAGSSA